MQLIAASEVVFSLGSKVLHLRPSLRCASRLERHYSGFEPMARAVADGSLSVVAHVIHEAQADRDLTRSQIENLLAHNLDQLDTITAQLIAVILALAGVDETPASTSTTASPQPATSTPKMTMADYFNRLFKIGTGWLGWSPNDTWQSSPAEILAAYEGRTELLQAIFGGGASDTTSTGPDDSALDSDGLRALKSLGSM